MFEKLGTMIRMDPKTRWFWFNTLVYMIIIILTTIFAYARLDYVRSYSTKPKQENTPNQ
jgi:hypothetical protein